MVSSFWNSQGNITVDYLEEGHMIDGAHYAELCQEIMKKKRKADSRCSALARQCTSTHLSSRYGNCD